MIEYIWKGIKNVLWFLLGIVSIIIPSIYIFIISILELSGVNRFMHTWTDYILYPPKKRNRFLLIISLIFCLIPFSYYIITMSIIYDNNERIVNWRDASLKMIKRISDFK